MFQSLGRLVIRLRFVIVAAWLLVAAWTFLSAPSLSKVGSADETTFLPADAGSMQARAILERAFPSEASASSATIVLHRPGGLTDADRSYAGDLEAWLTSSNAPEAVRRVVAGVQAAQSSPELASMFVSADGTTELLQVALSVAGFQETANQAVDAIRAEMAAGRPDGLETHVSGAAGIGRDYLGALVTGTDSTTLVTIVLVVVILLLIYRAPIAALVPLLTIGAAFVTARGLLGFLAEAGWKLPSLMDSFIVVLVFGVGTDYTIFLISRFREELGRHERSNAGIVTLGRIGAVITASAATVVVGLGSMAVGRFGMINTMGPGLALAILVTLVAGLTLTPALLAIAGHWLFWPLHEQVRAGAGTANGGVAADDAGTPTTGVWATIARWITTRPGLVAAVVLVVLLVPLAGLPRLASNFDVLNELPASADSRQGFELVAAHFDKGRLLPVSVLFRAVEGGSAATGSPAATDLSTPAGLAVLADASERLAAVKGVESVRSLVDPDGTGRVPDALRPSKQLAAMAEGFATPSDPTAALQKLLRPETKASADAGVEYLVGLADAYPAVANTEAFQAVRADMTTFRNVVAQVQAAAAAGATADPAALAQVGRQLAGLGARLATGLADLSTTFASGTDLYLPTSSTGTAGEQLTALTAAYLSESRDVSRLLVTTTDDPYAPGAFATVRLVGDAAGSAAGAASGISVDAFVGGPTAEFADVQSTISADFLRVGLITIVGIFLVLVVLLRSLVAPLYLVASVMLSFATTLGLSAILFQDVLGQPGLNYFIPLIVFVLLVALGSDYNIFLMSRVREESATRDLRAGIRVASIRTGTVITSAGIILAGTFAALITGQLQILFQAGATVALGVLIDTFLVRSLLIPAVTALLGEASWWPWGRRGVTPRTRGTAAPQPSR